jgi:hypothetical protein
MDLISHKNMRLTFVFFLIFSTAINACSSSSSLRIGWACFNGAQKIDCSYRKFSGREISTERLGTGTTVTVHYDITVDSGALTFTIKDPNGEDIFTVDLKEPLEDVHTFTPDEDGLYRFIVEGEETEGAFLITWNLSG